MSEAELEVAIAELEETRQTAERELDAVGGRREEIEQLERDRDALLASWSAAVPDNLDRLTPEGRNALYHRLRLEMRPKGTASRSRGRFVLWNPYRPVSHSS